MPLSEARISQLQLNFSMTFVLRAYIEKINQSQLFFLNNFIVLCSAIIDF